METQNVTGTQPGEAEPLARRLSRLGSSGHIKVHYPTCPQCGYEGPHHPLPGPFVECGHKPVEHLPGAYLDGCGYSWPTSYEHMLVPTDPVLKRLTQLLEETPDIGIVDTPHGAILEWRSVLDLARAIAGDATLRQLLTGGNTDTGDAA